MAFQLSKRKKRSELPENSDDKGDREQPTAVKKIKLDKLEDAQGKEDKKLKRPMRSSGRSAPRMQRIPSPEPMDSSTASANEPVAVLSLTLMREDGGGRAKFRKKQRSHPVERIDVS